MTHLRTGDRVQHHTTGKTGTVTNVTGSPGWVDQARVEWDDGTPAGTLTDWPPTDDLARL